jgi:hypothetical protein
MALTRLSEQHLPKTPGGPDTSSPTSIMNAPRTLKVAD